MKYFLATYEMLAGEHEHKKAVIFEAESYALACKFAEAEEFDPDLDSERFHFSFSGDGMTACRNISCQEISRKQVEFLEQTGLAYRK